MKIARFSKNGQTPRLGCFLGADRVMDLAASGAAFLASQGVVRAAPIADTLFPQSTRGFLEGGGASQEALDRVIEGARAGSFQPVTAPLSEVRLHAPINDPGKFICIGLNYQDHAAETGNPAPKAPPIFPKWNTALLDPGEPVLRPRGETHFDWEVELGVVIGRTARYVSREQALDHVYGYTIINDVSARDLQFADKQWQRGKSCDTFAPIGPSIVTRDTIPDPHQLRIRLRLNGEVLQDSSTNQLVFGVDRLVSFLSETVTLEPGDLIATGTPPGVGFARTPPVFLKPGDTVEVEVEGLGVLSNPVQAD